MHPMINIAITAARAAGSLINQSKDKVDQLKITEKRQNDYVTEVDKACERLIIETIRKSFPNHGILAEESGFESGDECVWIIDPLDGTKNFIHGFPHYAVSIGVKIKNTIDHGVIYDPSRDELFIASRGRGARLNEYRIRVSKRKAFKDALLGTGFPFRDLSKLKPYLTRFEAIFTHCSGVRRAGSAALDLAYVACGRLDGFWETGLNIWDIAAGSLIIEEAGGLVGDFSGEAHFLESGDIVTGNIHIYKSLLSTLTPYQEN